MVARETLLIALVLIVLATSGRAERLVAAQDLPAGTLLEPELMRLEPGAAGQALQDPADAVGLVVKVALREGRPILARQLGRRVLVARNATSLLTFHRGALSISAEVRALEAGSEGDLIRVLNIATKTTLTARVRADGSLAVPN